MAAPGAGGILVIRGGAIGDFVLTMPALSALRSAFPEVRLELLGYPHIARLAVEGGLVDGLRSIEAGALAGFFAKGGALDEGLADYFGSFGLILSYLYDPDEIFRVNVARCSGAQFIQGPHRPDEISGVHATSTFLRPLEKLAIFDAEREPRLVLRSRRDRLLPPGEWIALHPGSGSERKNWPEAGWRELMGYFEERTRWNILLLGGEAEGDRLKRLSKGANSGRVRLAQSRPLEEVAFLLSECGAFAGHDSGISHLAAALGLKGLVLWGPSNFDVWGPLSSRVAVMRRHGDLERVTAAEVAACLKGLGVD